MKLESIGEVIAERRLSVAGNPSVNIVVRMGKPQPLPEALGNDQFCPIQIIGVGDERVRYAAGIDAFQAIQLGMRSIAVNLLVIKRDYGLDLRWEGDEHGDLGFPPTTD